MPSIAAKSMRRSRNASSIGLPAPQVTRKALLMNRNKDHLGKQLGINKSKCLEKIVYQNCRQLWLVLGVKLMEINSNLCSRYSCTSCTLQGTNISDLGKRKIIFKMLFLGEMLVPWRVYHEPKQNFSGGLLYLLLSISCTFCSQPSNHSNHIYCTCTIDGYRRASCAASKPVKPN